MDHSFTGSILGDYKIQEGIGQGGMGVVYRARQLSLDRPVAIKILPPRYCADHDYVNRFLREARAAANLNHPNIIHVFDAGVSNDIYFFVMELMDGQNLGQVVRERGRLREYEALCTIYEVTKGLAFAHSKDIIHRDVKPENIMLTSHRAVKIGDLGLAKWKPKESELALTADGTSLGTPYYISPEQIRGGKDVDARSDIYSLGMTFDHLLRGEPAFVGTTPAEILAQHLSDEIPPIPSADSDISEPILELLAGMTAKKREDRIQQMSDVTNAIAQILGFQHDEMPTRQSPGARRLQQTTQHLDFSSKLWKIGVRALISASAVVVGLILALGIITVWNHYHSKVQQTTPELSLPARTVENTPSTPAIEPEGKVPPTFSEKGRKGTLGDSKPMEIQGINYIRAITISSNSNPGRLGDDWRKQLSKLEISNMEYSKSKVLTRVYFGKVEGMKTVDDFVQTVDGCESATLVFRKVGLFEDAKDVGIEARDILKPWGQKSPQLSPGLLERIMEKLGTKNIESKLDWSAEDEGKIFDFIKALDEETNWKWASHSRDKRWAKEGADEYGVDCGKEPLRKYNDAEKSTYTRDAQRLICFDVLPGLRECARKMKVTGNFITHHGWIIEATERSKGVGLNSVFSENGPRLILKKRSGAGQGVR